MPAPDDRAEQPGPARSGGRAGAVRTAVLVIDMINDYRHDDGEALRREAERATPHIVELVREARERDALVVHLNDNHGMWGASREEFVRAIADAGDHADLLEPILPTGGAPFLFKARHSAFYGSALSYLLQREGIGRVVLTGQVTEQCILYTALDAHVRHYAVVVPPLAVAHIDSGLADAALRMMRRNMGATLADDPDEVLVGSARSSGAG